MWIYAIIVATIIFGVSDLFYKNKNYSSNENIFVLSSLGVITGVLSLGYILYNQFLSNNSINLKNIVIDDIMFIIIFSVLSLLASHLYNYGLIKSPNAGYANALLSIQVIIVYILSILFLQAKFKMIGLLGVLMILGGSYLISMYG